MALNVIFNDINYQLLPKQREQFDKYCRILQWGRKYPTRFAEQFLNLQLTDMQKWVLLSSWVPATCVWCMSRSTGKACALNTRVYPVVRDREGRDGKVYNSPQTVGELQVGNLIYDSDGKPTEVIHLNPIILDDEYKVYFEDGEVISCNGEHLWGVYDFTSYKHLRRKELVNHLRIKQTNDIAKDVKIKDKEQYRYAVPINKAIEYENKKFLIEPYLLFLYLGDGKTGQCRITCHKDDIDEQIKILESINKNGWIFSKDMRGDNYGDIIISHKLDKNKDKYFCRLLKKLDCYYSKKIPEQYFYGDINQRWDMIRGIFDSDGSINTQGKAQFTQKNKEIAQGVYKILQSLGVKCSLGYRERFDKRTEKIYSNYYVLFMSGEEINPFYLQRKSKKIRKELPFKCRYKSIIKVERTGKKIPMRCITVSNESGLFLCGEHMTVTHNSYLAAIFIMLRSLLFPHYNSYIMGPTGSQSQETFTKLENIAKNNIASAIGITSVFIDECMRMNSKADPFTHNAQGYEVKLYNGSSVHSLNSVAKNIVGIRLRGRPKINLIYAIHIIILG